MWRLIAAVAAGCHCLDLRVSGTSNLQREYDTFAVGRVAIGANVSGDVGYVSLDHALTGAVAGVVVLPMQPTIILNVVAAHIRGGKDCG